MASTLLSPSRQQSTDTTPLWQAGLIAAVLSAVANATIYGVARVLGTIPQSVLVESPTGDEPITLVPVLLFSVLPIVVATLLYALLLRFTARPARTFWIIGVVVLVASFAMPVSIPGIPLKMAMTLNLMHLVSAVAALATLTRLARPE